MPLPKPSTKAPQKQKGKAQPPQSQKETVQESQKQKQKIPLEIKNKREWTAGRNRDEESSEESTQYETEDEDDEDWPKTPYVFGGPQVHDDAPKSISHPHTHSQSQPSGSTSYPKCHNGSKLPTHKSHNTAYTKGKRLAEPRRPKRVLNFLEDNLATAAYRKRIAHTGKFVLHKDCHEIEPSRTKLYNMLQEMGVRLGSFIRPPQEVKDRELLIWGNAGQVAATIAELQAWLSPTRGELMGRKSTAGDKFANEYSNIGTKYKTLQKKMLKDAAIQKFQQVPEAGKTYPFSGSLIWPVDELRPEDIFGSSCEAFDPIRFQCQCHIVFDNKEECFKVMTTNDNSVERSLLRIEGIMKEYVAKSSHRIIKHLVEPPSSSAIRKEIKTEDGPILGTATTPCKIPVLTGEELDPIERSAWVKRTAKIILDNHGHTEGALLECIPNLTFFRGQVHMRVHFGTFAMTLYKSKGESLPFEEWLENMKKTGTRGDLIKDLYNEKDAAAIMDNFHKAGSVFQPLSNSVYTLEEVAPSFSAHFQFQHEDQPAIQLDVELNSSGLDDNLYEKTHTLWTRLDRRDNAIPLSIFMVRLDGASWKLLASTENTIDPTRIQPKMTAFADSVKLRKMPKSKVAYSGEKVFQWEKDLPGTMLPTTFEQKTSFKYRLIHDVDWVFEISRYDTYGNPKDVNVPVKTCWAASMWNTEWDSTLAANAGLGIGEAATWEPNLATFFPSTNEKAPATRGVDPGVMAFLKNVKVVTEFLDGIKKEVS